MNNFIKRTMTISQRLSVGEIGLMKLYIIICGIILSIWIPALRTVSRWIWAIAAAIMIIPLLIQEFQQHPHYISQMFK
ncbi:MAG: hypothetical protein H6766_00210 [Candidatus Peribacteria bacterium]|nr:MAG: hypothetical protein H6766_00210 [Candidatus Peribacteria bacterium]